MKHIAVIDRAGIPHGVTEISRSGAKVVGLSRSVKSVLLRAPPCDLRASVVNFNDAFTRDIFTRGDGHGEQRLGNPSEHD